MRLAKDIQGIDEEYCEVCVEKEDGLLDRIGFAEYNKIVYD